MGGDEPKYAHQDKEGVRGMTNHDVSGGQKYQNMIASLKGNIGGDEKSG